MGDGPVAFVCAMPMELRPLTRRLSLTPWTEAGRGARQGRLGDRDVVAIVTGMGTALASEGMVRLFDAVLPSVVVVVGITGAVDDDTPIGTVVVPERVVDAASGREHVHRPIDGSTPRGVMWTTDSITPASALPALRAKGVVSLDMETAAIAQACEARAVAWTVFRAVSDRATDGSVDDELFRLSNQDGTPNPRAVLRYLVRHPQRIPRLARMGRDSKLATERAAEAAIAALTH